MGWWLRYHRALPCAHERLKEHAWEAVPTQAGDRMSRRFGANAIRNIANATELVRLCQLLSVSGIPHLAFKGPTLALRVYGSLSLRHAGDLDVIVDPEHFEQADEVVRSAGYRLIQPGFEMSPRQRRVCRTTYHHFVYRAPSGATTIDLHWRLVPNRLLLPVSFAQLAERADAQVIGGYPVPTFADADLVLYLLTHGANHAWFRLFWLHDAVGFIEQAEYEWGEALARASGIGLARPVLHAALLAHRLFGSSIPDDVLDEAMREPRMGKMVGLVIDRLVSQYDIYRPTVMGRIRRDLVYLPRLRSDLAYKVSILHRVLLGSREDWRMLPLPDMLFPLYYVLRFPMWCLRRVFNR